MATHLNADVSAEPVRPARRGSDLARAFVRSRWLDRAINALTILALLAAWVYVTQREIVRPLFLPPPQALRDSYQVLAPNLGQDIYDTVVVRIIPGFLIGSSLGLLLGVLMATSRLVRAVLDPIVEILRPLPPLALIPLLILWSGIGSRTQILLITYGTFIVMVITSYEAVRNVPPIYLQAADTLGATPLQKFRRVVIPAIIPDVFGGIRVATAASFGYAVAAELIGAQSGLGYRLILARRYLRTDHIVVILIVIAILAFIADQVTRRMNDRLTRWKSRI
ncbi:MAG: ABC transporter permease subunit [Anaerolineae bacterium]|nr:ABC transporter permease subunit [Anaerolineae bacterium]